MTKLLFHMKIEGVLTKTHPKKKPAVSENNTKHNIASCLYFEYFYYNYTRGICLNFFPI